MAYDPSPSEAQHILTEVFAGTPISAIRVSTIGVNVYTLNSWLKRVYGMSASQIATKLERCELGLLTGDVQYVSSDVNSRQYIAFALERAFLKKKASSLLAGEYHIWQFVDGYCVECNSHSQPNGTVYRRVYQTTQPISAFTETPHRLITPSWTEFKVSPLDVVSRFNVIWFPHSI